MDQGQPSIGFYISTRNFAKSLGPDSPEHVVNGACCNLSSKKKSNEKKSSCSACEPESRQVLAAGCIKKMQTDNIHLFGIGPTHWMGEGPFRINDTTINENYLVIHCGMNDTAYRGVAIVLSRRLQQFVTSYDFVSSRIVSVDLEFWTQNLVNLGTVIQVFAPRKDNPKIERDIFWQQLRDFVELKRSQQRWVLVMGDFDAPLNQFWLQIQQRLFVETLETPRQVSPENFIALFADKNCSQQPATLTPSLPNDSKCFITVLPGCYSPPCVKWNTFCFYNYVLNVVDQAHECGNYKGFARIPKIHWSDYALANNQPSAANASVYASQHTPDGHAIVKKLTNSAEIVQHMVTIWSTKLQIELVVQPTQMHPWDCTVLSLSAMVDSHMCANSLDLILDLQHESVLKHAVQEAGTEDEFHQIIIRLNGVVFQTCHNFVEWGGVCIDARVCSSQLDTKAHIPLWRLLLHYLRTGFPHLNQFPTCVYADRVFLTNVDWNDACKMQNYLKDVYELRCVFDSVGYYPLVPHWFQKREM